MCCWPDGRRFKYICICMYIYILKIRSRTPARSRECHRGSNLERGTRASLIQLIQKVILSLLKWSAARALADFPLLASSTTQLADVPMYISVNHPQSHYIHLTIFIRYFSPCILRPIATSFTHQKYIYTSVQKGRRLSHPPVSIIATNHLYFFFLT